VRAELAAVPAEVGDTDAVRRPKSSALAHGLRAQAPELIMAAPVEMWFGEARIGVKAGTKTHAQFRKYADVLLGDLKGKGAQSR
jgi:hypothetical protein